MPWRMVYLAGFPLDRMKVTLFDGSFHAVDSDQLSFELAAKMAYRELHLPKCTASDCLSHIMKLGGGNTRREHG